MILAALIYGPTPRRLRATIVAVLGLAGVIIGGLAIYRATRRVGNHGRRGAIAALVAGLIAVVNGGLNLAVATGGLVLARSRHTALEQGRMA
jgi:hypothetical protein